MNLDKLARETEQLSRELTLWLGLDGMADNWTFTIYGNLVSDDHGTSSQWKITKLVMWLYFCIIYLEPICITICKRFHNAKPVSMTYSFLWVSHILNTRTDGFPLAALLALDKSLPLLNLIPHSVQAFVLARYITTTNTKLLRATNGYSQTFH